MGARPRSRDGGTSVAVGLNLEDVPAGLSPMHLLVIFVVALVVLGPDKMPDAIRQGARFLGEAREWMARMSEEMQNVVSMQSHDVTAPPPEQPPTPDHSDDSTSTAPQPATPDAPTPDAGSASSASEPTHIGPTPASSPPVGDLPLIPKEHP